ncbi:MAG: glycosyltransferase family 1 protein [Chlamydiales bacterium]|jgi:glycosyltransferase involved in cell wall biosynthesis|nr:glycosyltransferase family 1 protein [Chlamydiales bacterium]
MTISHQVDLHTIGGVERLITDYLKASRGNFSHCITVMNRKIHPFIKQDIKNYAKRIDHLKYIWGLRLPQIFRGIRKRFILNKTAPQLTVYWNCYEQNLNSLASLKQNMLFYDHGASWNSFIEVKKKDFLRNIKGAIAIGHASKRMLELNCEVTCPIHVVKNPLRTLGHRNKPQPKTLPINRPLKLGMAGRMVPLKGHCLALHTLAILKRKGIEATLELAGEGEEYAALQSLARRLGIEKEILFQGCVQDIQNFYQSVDIYLHPAIREPFGLTPLEAMSYGCVVISSLVDGLPEFVQQGKTGFCIEPTLPLKDIIGLGGSTKNVPRFVYNPLEDCLAAPKLVDPYHIAESILAVLKSPKDFEKLSKEGIDYSHTHFQFDQYVLQLEQVFNQYI